MKYSNLILLICTFCSWACKSQTIAKSPIIDFVTRNNQIWCLTATGQLAVFNEGGTPVNIQIPQNKGISILTKDSYNNIIAADSNKHIRIYNDQTQSWKITAAFKKTLYGIVFDSDNQQYLITEKGIKAENEYYLPDTADAINKQIHFAHRVIAKPSAYCIDKNSNIWFGYAGGEWGGDIYVFSTRLKKFIKPKVKWVSPVKAIFGVDSDVYVSSGLQHFSTSGEILKFSNFTAQSIFESNSYKKDKNGNPMRVEGEYIGPATFNKFDGSIYFYSQHGFFKGDPKSDLSDIKNWEHVFSPKLHWTNGQSNAVGSPMNVLKIEFINKNTLLFCTANDGLCMYNGATQITLQ